MHQHLIIFTRYPQPGQTKTRLIPALGPQGAADLQREMTRHTLRWAEALAVGGRVSTEVRFEGGDPGRMQECFGTGFDYLPQGGGDLGQRMCRAFDQAFRSGADRVVIVGSDCPGLDQRLARSAFELLGDGDLVLGPATDGGYYLIGLRRLIPQLFAGTAWGGRDVLNQTVRIAERMGLSTTLLDTLSDVDRPEDLVVWERISEDKEQGPAPSVSVVIPTLNEAKCLPRTLASLRTAQKIEVIVVDAGSDDGTSEIAQKCGARVIEPVCVRGRQLNVGARAATGQYLVFLHADTQLPHRFDEHVRQMLDRPGVVAGAFRLSYHEAKGSVKIIEQTANLRAKFLRMPYGDQALFMTTNVFERVGGFPVLPIMEDYQLVRRLRRLGRIGIVDKHVITSARRWERLGPWKTTCLNQLIILAYWLGVSPDRLARWYRGVQPGDRTEAVERWSIRVTE